MNHGNRRRLDSDAHTHPNHRRSRKIQEIKEQGHHFIFHETDLFALKLSKDG